MTEPTGRKHDVPRRSNDPSVTIYASRGAASRSTVPRMDALLLRGDLGYRSGVGSAGLDQANRILHATPSEGLSSLLSLRSARRGRPCLLAGMPVLFTLACLDRSGVTDPRPPSSMAILEENLRVGSEGWDAGLHLPFNTPVDGYVLPISLQAGDTLHVFASAPSRSVTVQYYRLGWYGGSGARMVAEHVDRSIQAQPACSAPLPGPSVCSWSETDRIRVTSQWVPGVYLAKFLGPSGEAGAYPFIVRSDRNAAFEVVLPFATYEAYNNWGGTSLYYGPGSTRSEAYANRAVKVSFARPFALPDLDGQFLGIDYLLVRWLALKSAAHLGSSLR